MKRTFTLMGLALLALLTLGTVASATTGKAGCPAGCCSGTSCPPACCAGR